MRIALPVALLAVTACSSAEPTPVPDPIVELAPGPSAAPIASASALARRDEIPPSRLDAWTLPNAKGPKLGTACTPRPPSQDGEPKDPDTCGAAGKVALEFLPYRPLRGERPCDMHRLGKEERRGMYETMGCTDGDHLVLTSDCMVCRTTSGWAAHARLSELTAEQHRFLFQRLGYDPTATGPTAPAGWRDLVSKAPLEAKPSDAIPVDAP